MDSLLDPNSLYHDRSVQDAIRDEIRDVIVATCRSTIRQVLPDLVRANLTKVLQDTYGGVFSVAGNGEHKEISRKEEAKSAAKAPSPLKKPERTRSSSGSVPTKSKKPMLRVNSSLTRNKVSSLAARSPMTPRVVLYPDTDDNNSIDNAPIITSPIDFNPPELAGENANQIADNPSQLTSDNNGEPAADGEKASLGLSFGFNDSMKKKHYALINTMNLSDRPEAPSPSIKNYVNKKYGDLQRSNSLFAFDDKTQAKAELVASRSETSGIKPVPKEKASALDNLREKLKGKETVTAEECASPTSKRGRKTSATIEKLSSAFAF